MFKLLVTCPQLQTTLDEYKNFFHSNDISVTVPPVVQQLTEQDLLEIIGEFDGIIAGDDPVTKRVIEAGRRLRVICKWGVGLDAIDVDAARARGIPVLNTPGMFADEVADVALGYIVMLARGLHQLDRSVRKGKWAKIRGITLAGKTIGVVGVGSIGKAIIRRTVAFGLSPIAIDFAELDSGFLQETGTRQFPLEDALPELDFLVLACNLTAMNRHMINTRALERLKLGAYIVNVARGPLIDEHALVEALRQDRLSGAALDVFEVEPLPDDSPLRGFDNVILGTHNASNTHEGVRRVNEKVLANLLSGLARSHTDASLKGDAAR